jgi:hypothetical protein
MTWSPEGRRRPEMKWEREVERIMKQKYLTPEDAITGNYGEKRLRTSNRCNTGKLIQIDRNML